MPTGKKAATKKPAVKKVRAKKPKKVSMLDAAVIGATTPPFAGV